MKVFFAFVSCVFLLSLSQFFESQAGKRFAFVEFARESELDAALAVHGTKVLASRCVAAGLGRDVADGVRRCAAARRHAVGAQVGPEQGARQGHRRADGDAARRASVDAARGAARRAAAQAGRLCCRDDDRRGGGDHARNSHSHNNDDIITVVVIINSDRNRRCHDDDDRVQVKCRLSSILAEKINFKKLKKESLAR